MARRSSTCCSIRPSPSSVAATPRFNDKSFIPSYEAVAALSGADRSKAYIDLDEKVMTEAAPWAPLLVPARFDFVSSRLTGYAYSQAMDNVNYNTVGVTG